MAGAEGWANGSVANPWSAMPMDHENMCPSKTKREAAPRRDDCDDGDDKGRND